MGVPLFVFFLSLTSCPGDLSFTTSLSAFSCCFCSSLSNWSVNRNSSIAREFAWPLTLMYCPMILFSFVIVFFNALSINSQLKPIASVRTFAINASNSITVPSKIGFHHLSNSGLVYTHAFISHEFKDSVVVSITSSAELSVVRANDSFRISSVILCTVAAVFRLFSSSFSS